MSLPLMDDDGYVPIRSVFVGEANLEAMQHALKRLGFPSAHRHETQGSSMILTLTSTQEGADAADALILAARLTRRTVTSVALKFFKYPGTFAEWSALVRLDAEPRVLNTALLHMWPRKKRR